jgi:D-alanyl-D-alanine carboxypeptidase
MIQDLLIHYSIINMGEVHAMITEKIEALLTKSAKKLKTLQFAMNIPQLGINYSYSTTIPSQRFHSASVGKLMTAVMIFKGMEQGELTLHTPITNLLQKGLLEHLFVYEGRDYQDEVTVEQLLAHTSGVNDYFAGKTLDGTVFIDTIVNQPTKRWNPHELIAFTRTKQCAVGAPQQQFYYSDTGYVLLGLVVEAIYNLPFHQALQAHIFQPVGMSETCLCFYDDQFDASLLAPMYVNKRDIHLHDSLSCDFSGGGLSTTTRDLLIFLEHLQRFELISKSSLDSMAQFNYRYRQGIHYGHGMMQLRFEQFFFLLKHLPRLQGHLGVTGVHAWYDPRNQATFVMNVGNERDMVKSFKLLISILQIVQRGMVKAK